MFRAISTMIVVIAVVIASYSYVASSVVWAASPSVDCAKARSWAERNICMDEELASLDVQMTAVFERLRGALSGVARSDQVLYQRGFLRGRDICRTQAQAISPQECLKRIYQDRIAELDNYLAAVSVVGPSAQDRLHDCYAEVANRADTAPCLQLELDRVDADLNVAAEDMRVRMREMDSFARASISAEKRFTSSQEAFFKFRKASCEWRAAATAELGANRAFLACMVDLARTRMAEIEAVFVDWQPQKP